MGLKGFKAILFKQEQIPRGLGEATVPAFLQMSTAGLSELQ